jgi:sorbitol-specific phosphotransferase system component IIA
VAAGIIASELHKRPSDAWITTHELRQTEAFANSAFSKSPDSMVLFATGVSELDKLNFIRRNAGDQNRLHWKRPNYRQQYALCKDDFAIQEVSKQANSNLMEKVEVDARRRAAMTQLKPL